MKQTKSDYKSILINREENPYFKHASTKRVNFEEEEVKLESKSFFNQWTKSIYNMNGIMNTHHDSELSEELK